MDSLNPDFGPDSVSFPALPPIHSDSIRLRVFTHRSFYARPTQVFEDPPDDPSPDNEKLELLGDTVLGLVVTDLLMEMHPGLRVGPSTKMRAMIVGNPTLAEISMRYDLPSRLRLHAAQAISLRASTNIRADVFESYVGGLYMDQGIAAVASWLKLLIRPYSTAAYHLVRSQHGLPLPPSPSTTPLPMSTDDPSTADCVPLTTTIGHLALFNQHLQKANRVVEWVYSDGAVQGRGSKTTPVWAVSVLVDGNFFGRGRGYTKKAARNEAAKIGLQNLGIFVW